MDSELLIDIANGVAVVTLNRPKALNALTEAMVAELGERMRAWASDGTVRAVVFRGEGDKAFCAGGDIRRLYDARLAAGTPTAFFYDEYRMNVAIHHFPKPVVALMDGVVMGGGVGVAAPARYRVATERSLWAMPETGIGLFPDVGGSWHLSRLHGRLGVYLGLTGHRLKAADLLWSGLATHYVPYARIASLTEAMAARPDDIDAVLAGFAADPGTAPLAAHAANIDRLFAGDSVEAILEALDADGGEWAVATAMHLRRMSPTSMKLALAAQQRGAALDFDDVMRMEYRVVSRIMQGHDFVEGVRAVLVDRDHAPKWSPATLDAVTGDAVAGHFAPLDHELQL